jgi:hypothetical protein
MAKFVMNLTGPWDYWWEVSFYHIPWEYRLPGSYHLIHCYNLITGWPWPEMDWYLNFQNETNAKGFLKVVLADPSMLYDVCGWCNTGSLSSPRMPRWNIHRGEDHLWRGAPFIYEPWPP